MEREILKDSSALSSVMPRVLISDPISDEGVNRLENEGYTVNIRTDLSNDKLKAEIGGYDAIVVRSGTEMTEEVISEADNLKIIGRAGVGVDNIDINAATQKGVVVANAPQGNTVAASEHAVSLLLSAARNIPTANEALKEGEWLKSENVGVEIKDKTLGVFGLGRIGGEVAKRGKSLGMKVKAFDPFVSETRAADLGAELCDMNEVLEESDFISVHTPLNEETRHLISTSEFEIMKNNAILAHASRGGVVDEEAAAEAVKSGQIAKAAFDVFENEPPEKDNPLLDVEDVIVTPHLGASTEEAQLNVASTIADQVIDVLEGGVASTALNVPTVDAEEMERLQPYMDLAETIGRITVQISQSNVNDVEIEYSGEIAKKDVSPISIAAQQGFLEPILDDPVNFVNAESMMEARGVKIKETKTEYSEDFVSLITVRVDGPEGPTEVAGTLFGKSDPTIVNINGYRVDAQPTKNMLIVHNVDKPGMVGKVGSLLGEFEVNIAGMHNGRETVGGEAIMVLNVDGKVSEEARDRILEVDGIKGAEYVSV
ncbi:MAG: phosphoglycerate dehydrogenase [Halobacteria archaeon]